MAAKMNVVVAAKTVVPVDVKVVVAIAVQETVKNSALLFAQ